MTRPIGPILGKVHLDDQSQTKFIWMDEGGIGAPAGLAQGSVVDTFGGPIRVKPSGYANPQKEMVLAGYLVNYSGQAEGYVRLSSLYGNAADPGITSQLQVGTFKLNVFPGAPEITKLKSHSKIMGYQIDATAVPGAWEAMYQYATAASLGMVVRSDIPGTHPVTTASTNPLSLTNPGTAPTPLVATISITTPTRTTRFFVRVIPSNGSPGKRISVTPDATGVATITAADNLMLAPGRNVLRFEESAGGLISSGTILTSIYGTKFYYLGHLGTEAFRWPVLENTRITYGSYSTLASGVGSQTTSLADQTRIGAVDAYTFAKSGLIVEAEGFNEIVGSEDHDNAVWTKLNCTVPVTNESSPYNTTTGDKLQASLAPGNVYQNYTVANRFGTDDYWTFSAFAKIPNTTPVGTTLYMEILNTTTGLSLVSQSFTVTSAWQRFSITTPATVAPGQVLRVIIGPDQTSATANVTVWGTQLEGHAYRSSYIQSPTNATTPASGQWSSYRGSDLIYINNPQNYLSWSNDISKTTAVQFVPGLYYYSSGAITRARVAGPNGYVLDGWAVTFTAASQYIEQYPINTEMLYEKTGIFSVWAKSNTTTPQAIRLRITNAGTSVTSQVHTVDQYWRRIAIHFNLSGSNTNPTVRIESLAAQTVHLSNLQVIASERMTDTTTPFPQTGGVYIPTLQSPILPQDAYLWPKWLTQNGFVQFDMLCHEPSRPNLKGRLYFGGNSTATASTFPKHPVIWRPQGASSAVNDIYFNRRTISGINRGSFTTAVNLYNDAYHTIRMEWLNYLIGSTRTMQVKAYVDGVLRTTDTAPGTETAWLEPERFILNQGISVLENAYMRSHQSYKNFSMGVPELPAGAIPSDF